MRVSIVDNTLSTMHGLSGIGRKESFFTHREIQPKPADLTAALANGVGAGIG